MTAFAADEQFDTLKAPVMFVLDRDALEDPVIRAIVVIGRAMGARLRGAEILST